MERERDRAEAKYRTRKPVFQNTHFTFIYILQKGESGRGQKKKKRAYVYCLLVLLMLATTLMASQVVLIPSGELYRAVTI